MRLRKLFTSSPAPITSITATAISVTTRSERPRNRALPSLPDRPPSRNELPRFTRAARRAGTAPKTRPVTIESSSANAITVAFTPSSSARGMLVGAIAPSSRTPAHASSRPSAPPPNESSKLSVSDVWSILALDAPSAVRTAISRSLASARVSSRFATFEELSSRRSPTAPSRMNSATRTPPFTSSASPTANALKCALTGHWPSSVQRFATTCRSRVTCATVTPGLSRTSPNIPWLLSGWLGSSPSGVNTSARVRRWNSSGMRNSRGRIPTTAYDAPSSWIVRPTSALSPPYLRCQSPHPTTATRGPFGTSSAAVIHRPPAGLTPSTSNTFAETPAVSTLSGDPSPVSATVPLSAHAASPAKRSSCRWYSKYSRVEIHVLSKLLHLDQIRASVPGSRYGSGRSSTASTTLKIAALAPIPSASVSSTTLVNSGRRRSERNASRASFRSVVIERLGRGVVPWTHGRSRWLASRHTPAARRMT